VHRAPPLIVGPIGLRDAATARRAEAIPVPARHLSEKCCLSALSPTGSRPVLRTDQLSYGGSRCPLQQIAPTLRKTASEHLVQPRNRRARPRDGCGSPFVRGPGCVLLGCHCDPPDLECVDTRGREADGAHGVSVSRKNYYRFARPGKIAKRSAC